MKLILRIQFHSNMSHESSNSSDEESPMETFHTTVKTIMPIVDDLHRDMANIGDKFNKETISWLERPVTPLADSIKNVWTRNGDCSECSLHKILNALLLKARSLDLESRTIYFSEGDAADLGRQSMTVFELLHFLVDSVEWL